MARAQGVPEGVRTVCAEAWRQEGAPQILRPVGRLGAWVLSASWGLVAKEAGRDQIRGAWLSFSGPQISFCFFQLH